jgi:LPXTG-motif cell wall-anchored protein
MLTQTIKRVTAATFVGALLTVSPLAISAATAAPPANCGYSVQATTTTTVSISPTNPAVGSTFTATASVTNDATGTPVTSGTVTFRYHGVAKTSAVSGGQASATFTAARGNSPVNAQYSGTCVRGAVVLGTSATRVPVVAGVSASRNVVEGTSAGVLAATGVDSQTELYGILGVGMVAVGGLTLLVHRRRVQA